MNSATISAGSKNSPGRIAQLDGARGLAFLLVYMAHLQLPPEFIDAHPWLVQIKELGWIGVSVFFILSGYLITELALREGDQFSLLRFHARRALRLWPLYITASVLALLAWQVPLLRSVHVATSSQWALPLFTFTVNFSLREHWSALGSMGFLIVFWTLSVEEQFYATWSVVLRWASRHNALAICACILVAAQIARFTIHSEKYFLFYRMHTLVSFGTIMLGCGLALIGVGRFSIGSRASNIALATLLAAAAALAYFEWPFPSQTRYAGILVDAADLLCLALLLLAICGSGILRTFLEWRPMRLMGELSYAGYVLHLGALWFYSGAVRPNLPLDDLAAWPIAAVALDAVIVLSFTILCATGWHALEAPFRRARARLHIRYSLPVEQEFLPR